MLSWRSLNSFIKKRGFKFQLTLVQNFIHKLAYFGFENDSKIFCKTKLRLQVNFFQKQRFQKNKYPLICQNSVTVSKTRRRSDQKKRK